MIGDYGDDRIYAYGGDDRADGGKATIPFMAMPAMTR
ncbi:hypothetical protein [Rhodophyticola sp.]